MAKFGSRSKERRQKQKASKEVQRVREDTKRAIQKQTGRQARDSAPRAHGSSRAASGNKQFKGGSFAKRILRSPVGDASSKALSRLQKVKKAAGTLPKNKSGLGKLSRKAATLIKRAPKTFSEGHGGLKAAKRLLSRALPKVGPVITKTIARKATGPIGEARDIINKANIRRIPGSGKGKQLTSKAKAKSQMKKNRKKR